MRTTTFSFRHRIYWGVSVAGTYDESFIKTLASNQLSSAYNKTFGVTAGASQYIYFAIPKSYVSSAMLDPPYFFLGTTIPGGMEIVDSAIDYNFENLVNEDYILYKSANSNLGSVDVEVSETLS